MWPRKTARLGGKNRPKLQVLRDALYDWRGFYIAVGQRWIRSTARASRFKSLATIRQQALPKLFGHLLIETWMTGLGGPDTGCMSQSSWWATKLGDSRSSNRNPRRSATYSFIPDKSCRAVRHSKGPYLQILRRSHWLETPAAGDIS